MAPRLLGRLEGVRDNSPGTIALGRLTARIASWVLVCALWLAAFDGAARAGTLLFPHPTSLQPNVAFWVDVFTVYHVRDFVVHDRDNLEKIYGTLRLPGEGEPTRDDVDWANAYLKLKYSRILNRLAGGGQPMGADERRVASAFKGEPLSAFAEAAQNMRVQQGLRERFHDALLRSRYYRPTMEGIFRAAGLPVELIVIAQVESGVNPRARSSAGATGIWQFTRATGRQYLRITRWHDERLDPLRSTEAAAQLLRHNYLTLGDWPLAITAYDYGTAGTARAAESYGRDLSRIVEHYKGGHFGFASRNYYAEFLAALQVNKFEGQYFPGIQYEAALAPPPPSRATHYVRRSPMLHRVVAHLSKSHGLRIRRHSGHSHRHRSHRRHRVEAT